MQLPITSPPPKNRKDLSMSDELYEAKVPPGYAAMALVQPPPGYEEVSRIFDLETNTLLKVFFRKSGQFPGQDVLDGQQNR